MILTSGSFDLPATIGEGVSISGTGDGSVVKVDTNNTAENVESLLLDMTGSDGTNLKNCTIIVNGTTVVLR